jgi:hypothetical protein
LPSIINRMLQEGQEGALVTGICARRTNRKTVDFNNNPRNTVQDFAMEYFNFHEEGTLRKKALLSCTAASAMPTKCNF